ncbi:hypothetical protein LJC56_06780 [Christensenellaceae bacterium OttesenSCG-928-K19]|nr:hypothetical protein [Christensenellaceae bacterium OttesenSCG-928-K19]
MKKKKTVIGLFLLLLMISSLVACAAKEPIVWEGSSTNTATLGGEEHSSEAAEGDAEADTSDLLETEDFTDNNITSKKVEYVNALAAIVNNVLVAEETSIVIDEDNQTCSVIVKGATNEFFETTPEQEIDQILRESLERDFELPGCELDITFK